MVLFLYLFLSIIYICIINVFPTFMREKIAIIMIYSDPAAMGLFLWELLYFLRKVKGF
ncbi:putative membrane protein [Clostridioides difficile DA00165]|nr:putative membrane protein [Clostridioides difficile DA00165]